MKKIFFLIFVICAILFLYFLQTPKTYFYVIFAHLGLLSLSLTILYEKNLAETVKALVGRISLKKIVIEVIKGYVIILAILLVLSIILSAAGISDQKKIRERVQELPWHTLAVAILIAPLSEELFFRGFLSRKIGIAFSSMVFALAHLAYGSIAELFGAFFIGAYFAWIYKKNNSIIPNIILHMIYNLSSITLMLVLRANGW